MKRWDYIIVGAGSAGCALAHELLTSNASCSVLMLEAGGSDRSPFIKFPAGQIRAVLHHDWGYHSQPDPSRHNISEPWFRGRVLGGSSSVNGTVYTRGPASDFDAWAAELGSINSSSWSSQNVMAIYKDMENSDQEGALRGKGGPLNVRTVSRPHRLTEAFLQAAEARGYRLNPDYNGFNQEGLGLAQLTKHKGRRWSAADAFLRPILGNPRFHLIKNVLAEKVECEDGRAHGVSFLDSGISRREYGSNIVLCAGAINSPKLLMLSGIGNRVELEPLGIPVTAGLNGVGRNLREHPLIRLTYRTKIHSNNMTAGFLQKLNIASQCVFRGEGPISNLFEAVGFLRSSDHEPAPDIKMHFLTVGYSPTAEGSIALAPYPAVTVLVAKSHPLSSGRIRLASKDPADPPLIECRLLEKEEDVATLARGIEMARAIMGAEPMNSLVEEEVNPGANVQSESDLHDYIRANTTLSYHPAGTCRMGLDQDAVVGPDLRVHGIENLWVADASVMPTLISADTNAACMMIGRKLGRELNSRSDRES